MVSGLGVVLWGQELRTMLCYTLQYVGVLPFFIKVEGPDQCRQGEQIGLRVVVFNYTPQNLEAVVVLEASPDYKFVHVEQNGIVSVLLFY